MPLVDVDVGPDDAKDAEGAISMSLSYPTVIRSKIGTLMGAAPNQEETEPVRRPQFT